MSVNTNTSMTIRMDKDVKMQAQKIFSEIGMDMTTAVNVFLKQAIRYNGFPFELRVDNPNLDTIEAINEVETMKLNPNLGKSYSDVDFMMEELLK